MTRLLHFVTIMAVLVAIWILWPVSDEQDVVRVEAPQKNVEGPGAPDSTGLSDQRPAADLPDWAQFDDTDFAKATPSQQAEDSGKPGAKLPPQREQITQEKRYYRVVVQGGGALEANGTKIVLSGIAVKSLTGQCKDISGVDWPCGRYARTALTRLIRGRAVLCKVPASRTGKTLTARCSVGGKDLSLWLVRHGWAEPKRPAKAEMTAALDSARKRRVGIWR